MIFRKTTDIISIQDTGYITTNLLLQPGFYNLSMYVAGRSDPFYNGIDGNLNLTVRHHIHPINILFDSDTSDA